jgi:hypothetical protein
MNQGSLELRWGMCNRSGSGHSAWDTLWDNRSNSSAMGPVHIHVTSRVYVIARLLMLHTLVTLGLLVYK